MKLRFVILSVGAAALLLWWAQRATGVLGSIDPAHSPRADRAGYQPAPLPALDSVDAPARPLPTDAILVAANSLKPVQAFAQPSEDTSAGAGAPAARVLGSLRMVADPEGLGATAQGFVPIGAHVPQPGTTVEPPPFDLTDPEELRIKREAGDFDNPIGVEEQIKRNAYGNGQVGPGDTAGGWANSVSGSEVHVDGVVVDSTNAPNLSATERHTNGRRPVTDWRAIGQSPTEANAVSVEDVTRRYVAPPEPPSDTIAEDLPVPTWQGEGTERDP